MNFQKAHLIASIQVLFRHDERLIYFFFHHKRPELRLESAALLAEARGLSSGEYLLIQAALDFWNGEGNLRFAELLGGLDEENIWAVVQAILYWREIVC